MRLYKKQLIAAVALFVLAISVPVTLSLIQQRQDNRSKASASTTLSFSPSTIANVVGDTIAVDVMINPGTNLVSYVKFEAKFDPTVLQLDSTTPFVSNTAAFPTQVQAPVVSSGSIKAAVSIGPDLTKAIQTPTKVGTLYFKAIHITQALSSSLSFGDITQVLSINPSDNPTENVLSIATPATVIIATSAAALTPTTNLTPSPTTTASATPTATLSAQPTGLGGPTATPSATLATASPTVLPTVTPSITVKANLNVILHAIGVGGDNINPTGNSFSNKNPVHASRSATVSLYNAADLKVTAATGTIYYSTPSGSFIGSVNLTPPALGYYTMRIRTDNHLSRKVPGIILLTSNNQTLSLPPLQYVAGDANNDNTLNILDYNMMFGCYGPNNAVTCDDDKKLASDFNDDGQVNQVDYNLFLRELSISFGD